MAVKNVCRQRSIFQCADGKVGLGSTATKAGDVICLLQGASVPYVLRPVPGEDESKRYWLVGECYIDGYMYAQALITVEDFGGWEGITLC